MQQYNVIAEQENSTVMAHYEPMPREDKGYQSEAALETAFIQQLVEQGYERVNIKSEQQLVANLQGVESAVQPAYRIATDDD